MAIPLLAESCIPAIAAAEKPWFGSAGPTETHASEN